MDGIDGAAWHLMIQIWALSSYGLLAGVLMFGNEQGMPALFAASRFVKAATATRLLGPGTPHFTLELNSAADRNSLATVPAQP